MCSAPVTETPSHTAVSHPWFKNLMNISWHQQVGGSATGRLSAALCTEGLLLIHPSCPSCWQTLAATGTRHFLRSSPACTWNKYSDWWQNFAVSGVYAQELHKHCWDGDARGLQPPKPLVALWQSSEECHPPHSTPGRVQSSGIINPLAPWQSSLSIAKERTLLISSQDRRWSLSIIPSSWSLLPESPHQQNCLSEQTAGGKGLPDWWGTNAI